MLRKALRVLFLDTYNNQWHSHLQEEKGVTQSVTHKYPFFRPQTESLIRPNEGSVHPKQTLCFPQTERLFYFLPQ